MPDVSYHTPKNREISLERLGRWPGPLLTQLIGEPELIDGGGACPVYLARWVLCKLPFELGKLYVHAFYAEDWSKDLHDHPKRFISIGLWGSYVETFFDGPPDPGAEYQDMTQRTYRAPWIRTFPAKHAHRVRPLSRTCWTLVHVGGSSKPWGFYHRGVWRHWREYLSSGTGKGRKACQD